MPYIQAIANPKCPLIYDVEFAVGANAPNRNGDVKLVQYLLRCIYGKDAAGLAVDGWIGPVTLSWIRRYQAEANAGGTHMATDGRVDRAFHTTSTISKTVYTIVGLNIHARSNNPAAYARLPQLVPMNTTPSPTPYTAKPAASGGPQIPGSVCQLGRRGSDDMICWN